MNREQYLQETFPLPDGTTYIQSLDKHNSIINEFNIKDCSIGVINKFIKENVPRHQWGQKIIEFLNLLNPNISYNLEDYNMKLGSKVSYKCKIHPDNTGTVGIASIFFSKTGNCATCTNGSKRNGYWTVDNIKNELKIVITKYYNETNIIPTLSVVNQELIRGVSGSISRIGENGNKFYLKFLEENGYPQPDDYLYKDGVIFRGHYEYVGYCFVKSWGINIEPIKKMGKYYSDGYFTDINTYWEHWGGLNKNNTKKKKLYEKNKFNLFETHDKECIKRGYVYLYNTMRDFFIDKGYNIPEFDRNELYKLLKKDLHTFDTKLNWIVNILKTTPEFNKNLTTKQLLKFDFGHNISFFIEKRFNGITNFKEYLNENYGFNYPLQRHVNKYYYLDEERFFNELTPIIIKYGRLPSKLELIADGRRDIDRFIKKQIGGFKDMRRNEIHVGKYFHIIDRILNGKAPWDLKIDWETDFSDTVNKIIQYWKTKNINLPHYYCDLICDEKYGNLGVQLHNIINRRTHKFSDIKNWTHFKQLYDGYEGGQIPEKRCKKNR